MRQVISSFPPMSLAALQRLAGVLARRATAGDVLALSGDLGAGKTEFARAFIRTLASAETQVTSPTFNLMQQYDVTLADGRAESLWHLDLYRLETEAETLALGLDELWPHLLIIEWPEILGNGLPASRLAIAFTFTGEPALRKLELSGDAAWAARLKGVELP